MISLTMLGIHISKLEKIRFGSTQHGSKKQPHRFQVNWN